MCTKERACSSWHGSADLSFSGDGLLYVRLTGLTFESQNGAVQGPSRIIQPLARFTDNKTSGRMHFVPPQRTYLKLHNPAKLVGGIMTSILLTIQKSKCKKIKCCGCECDRDPTLAADKAKLAGKGGDDKP